MKRARKPATLRATEADLKRSVLDALRLLPGVHALRLNAGATVIGEGKARRMIVGVEAGTPDVLVMLKGGHCCWLELKTSTGRVSPAQRAWHAMAANMGHRVSLVRSTQQAIDAVQFAQRDLAAAFA